MGDPFAAAKFFHHTICTVLKTLFGIRGASGKLPVKREVGIFGTVNAYIGTVEAQGRGTLHVHMLLWLKGAPSSGRMKEALELQEFQEKVVSFIRQTIRADLDGATAAEVLAIPLEAEISYNRPIDPKSVGYDVKAKAEERKLARALQVHECSNERCLQIKNGCKQCKRRAPFPLAGEDWVNSDGDWGAKRTYAYLNNWSPELLQCLRCNHDVKLLTNGGGTKAITFYITSYATKKQDPSSNTSALLAKRLAFHHVQEKFNADYVDMNRKMLIRCANTLTREHECSAPEVMSYLMGWGDRFLSHLYVSIFWDTAVGGLKMAFPQLRRKTHIGAAIAGLPDRQSTKENEYMRLDMVDGELKLRDQLKEYADRGLELDCWNFMDYFTHTYDTEITQKEHMKQATVLDMDNFPDDDGRGNGRS
ncbi:hypothetical protein FPV67DRAFT_1785896, partial [Lyophyllum atratum]